MKGLNYSP